MAIQVRAIKVKIQFRLPQEHELQPRLHNKRVFLFVVVGALAVILEYWTWADLVW